MNIALLHNHYSVEHLAGVIEEMKVLGAPKIKAVWMDSYEFWAAIEGCHRIRAAKVLGLTPEIVEIEYNPDRLVNDPNLGLDLDNDGENMEWILSDCHRNEIIGF